jgi:hypothetical protein
MKWQRIAGFSRKSGGYNTRPWEAMMNYENLIAESEQEVEAVHYRAWVARFRIQKRDTTSRYSRRYSIGWYVQRCDEQGQWHDILNDDGRGYLCSESEAGARWLLKEAYGIVEDVPVDALPIPERVYGPMIGGNASWGAYRI